MTEHPGVTGRRSGSLTGRSKKTSAADIAAAQSEFSRESDVDTTGADIAGNDAPSALALIKSPTKQRGPPRSTEDVDAFSIEEFCRRHRVSRSTFYNMRALGLGPKEMRVMGRALITREAAEAWRRAREQITEPVAEPAA
jgi:hypothetical protein